MNNDELARNIVDAVLAVLDQYAAITMTYEETMYERLCNNMKDAVLRQLPEAVARVDATYVVY